MIMNGKRYEIKYCNIEMSKTYKVHKYFDLDDLTTEEPCRCSSPESGISIFTNIGNATGTEKHTLDSYNKTMNGTIFSAEDVDWAGLKTSECQL